MSGWFTNLATSIEALDFERPIQAGRMITQLMQALDDVQEFHQIATSLQIKQVRFTLVAVPLFAYLHVVHFYILSSCFVVVSFWLIRVGT